MQQGSDIKRMFMHDPVSGVKHVHDLYADKMMFLAVRYVTDECLAEEIVSDTFITIFHKWNQFDENKGSDFISWMSKICIHRCLMELRKKKILKESLTDSHKEISFELPDHLTYQNIVDAVRSLGHPYNTIFFLFEIDGFSHREISEMLRIPEGSSKSYLSRAKKRLRNLLFDMV